MITEATPLFSDLYAFRMAENWFRCGLAERRASFEIFFRRLPSGERYGIFAGADAVRRFLRRFRFTREEIAYLRESGGFDPAFLEWLERLRFQGSVYAVREGTPIFPGEPILTVTAPLAVAALLETALLSCVGLSSRVAALASQLSLAARGRPIVEMGARRAHGRDAALLGARAAYIGGCAATTLTEAAARFGIPAVGTMSHAWVSSFPDEKSAFLTFLRQNPCGATLVVDTYDTIRSGIPSAISAIAESGAERVSLRLDSGDLALLSVRARSALDEAGLRDCRIMASGSLDKTRIEELCDCPIDSYGVGGNLITGGSSSVPGFVFKLTALEDEGGRMLPRIKLSDEKGKETIPGEKKLYRLLAADGRPIGDLLVLCEEEVYAGEYKAYRLADGLEQTVRFNEARLLREPLFENGRERDGEIPLSVLREGCRRSLAALPLAESYPVLLSARLYRLAAAMGAFRK